MKRIFLNIIYFLTLTLLFIGCQQAAKNSVSATTKSTVVNEVNEEISKTYKSIVNTSNAPAAIGPYSQGVVAQGFLFTSGQLPINPSTSEIPETIEEQTKQVLDNLKAIVEEAGSSLDNVVKCTVYLQDMNDFSVVNTIYATYFKKNPPARACIEVSKIAKSALVEIDAIVALN